MNPGSRASPRDSAVKRLQEATRLRRRVGTLIIGSTVLPQIGPENGLSRVGIDVEGAINSGQSTRSESSDASAECAPSYGAPSAYMSLSPIPVTTEKSPSSRRDR
jgi:hypothetical protein